MRPSPSWSEEGGKEERRTKWGDVSVTWRVKAQWEDREGYRRVCVSAWAPWVPPPHPLEVVGSPRQTQPHLVHGCAEGHRGQRHAVITRLHPVPVVGAGCCFTRGLRCAVTVACPALAKSHPQPRPLWALPWMSRCLTAQLFISLSPTSLPPGPSNFPFPDLQFFPYSIFSSQILKTNLINSFMSFFISGETHAQ